MSTPQPQSFGYWLKRLRAQHDLTQDELAEQVSCAVYTVRTYEMGTRRPSRAMAERLADVLQVPAADRMAFLQSARAPLGTSPLSITQQTAQSHQAAPLQSDREPIHQMPIPAALNALVGRATELDETTTQLRDPACRLLTLLGPGGVGKTRLALQLATNMARDTTYDHEVVWVELAALTTAAHLPSAICDALGAPVVGAVAPDTHLLATLAARRLLLVLDNFEHLLDGAALLAAILRAAPHVRILVTSRERLRVQGEWVYELDGLAVPPSDAPASERSGAMLLFLERARQVDHTFALTGENAVDVARVCRLLAGMPLGIELAATWVRFLACDAIASEIERSMDFLTVTSYGAPPRHQSLRAVFDHSWQLLAPAERRVLARLSVFRGSSSREAAVTVADANMPLLAALIDASLVRRISSESGGRYALHELVRQYAADQLRGDPDNWTTTTARHAAFFATRLHDHVEALQSGRQPETMDQLRPDLDNVWQAWAWAVRQPDPGMLRRMARGVVTLCEDLGSLQEGARLFGEAVAALEGVASGDVETGVTLGDMLTRHGYFLGRCGQLVEGERQLRAALTMLPAHDYITRGHALTQLALLGYQQGEFAEARRWAQEAMTVLRIGDDQFYLGLATCFAGMTTLAQGNYPEAEAYLAESITLWQNNGYPRGLAVALCEQSWLALASHEHRQAYALAQQAVHLCAGQRDRWGMALALSTLGMAALARSDVTEARALCDEGAEIARVLGERWGLCRALLGSGWAMIAAGDHAAAGSVFREVVHLGHASSLLPLLLHALLGLGMLAFEDKDVGLALLYLATVRQHPATDHQVRVQAEAQWERYALRVGTQRTMQVWNAVHDIPVTMILDRALRVP